MSELVAKWLSTTGIDPARLIDTTDVEFDQLQLSVDSLQLNDALDEASAVDIPKQEQTKLLSLSVEIGDEAKVDTTVEARILGKIYIYIYPYIFILYVSSTLTRLKISLYNILLSECFFFFRSNDFAQTSLSVQFNEQRLVGQSMLGVRDVVEQGCISVGFTRGCLGCLATDTHEAYETR